MVIGGERRARVSHRNRAGYASTEPPMVIGGEQRIDRRAPLAFLGASTEPPMVIGGEFTNGLIGSSVFLRLQRSRRW